MSYLSCSHDNLKAKELPEPKQASVWLRTKIPWALSGGSENFQSLFHREYDCLNCGAVVVVSNAVVSTFVRPVDSGVVGGGNE